MKPKTWSKILAVVLLLSTLAACSSGGPQASVPAATAAPTTPPPRGDDSDGDGIPDEDDPDTPPEDDEDISERYNWPSGSTVNLQVDSYQTLESFLQRPANIDINVNPVMKMNVDLDRYRTTGFFSGKIRLAFEEASSTGSGTKYNEYIFDAGNESLSNLTLYNGFYNIGGVIYFKGFAQDRFGGLIIIVDQADGVGPLSGTIYFKNFQSTNVQSQEYCWNIKSSGNTAYSGYDCRDFLVNNNINMTSSVHPNRTINGQGFYTRLGTFSMLNGSTAIRQ
ncbi:MAG: hypothetical protein AB7F59_01795 [Bdellovibrionales bacterium]